MMMGDTHARFGRDMSIYLQRRRDSSVADFDAALLFDDFAPGAFAAHHSPAAEASPPL